MSFSQPFEVLLYSNAVASSVTGTTSITTLMSYTMKANTMGINDWLEIFILSSYTDSVNNKTLTLTIGATNVVAAAFTTTDSQGRYVLWSNQNSLSSQSFFPASANVAMGTSTAGSSTSAENCATDLTLAFKATLANAADTYTIQAAYVKLFKAMA